MFERRFDFAFSGDVLTVANSGNMEIDSNTSSGSNDSHILANNYTQNLNYYTDNTFFINNNNKLDGGGVYFDKLTSNKKYIGGGLIENCNRKVECNVGGGLRKKTPVLSDNIFVNSGKKVDDSSAVLAGRNKSNLSMDFYNNKKNLENVIHLHNVDATYGKKSISFSADQVRIASCTGFSKQRT